MQHTVSALLKNAYLLNIAGAILASGVLALGATAAGVIDQSPLADGVMNAAAFAFALLALSSWLQRDDQETPQYKPPALLVVTVCTSCAAVVFLALMPLASARLGGGPLLISMVLFASSTLAVIVLNVRARQLSRSRDY